MGGAGPGAARDTPDGARRILGVGGAGPGAARDTPDGARRILGVGGAAGIRMAVPTRIPARRGRRPGQDCAAGIRTAVPTVKHDPGWAARRNGDPGAAP